MSSGSQGKPAESQAAVLPDSSSVTEENPRRGANRGRLLVAGGLAAVWIVGLLVLAWTTANPITLNRKQIQHCHFLVTATRESDDSSILVVTKEWKYNRDLGKISVINLDQIEMPAGQEFLVPLDAVSLRDDEPTQYLITRTTLPDEAPLIYPATPEAKSALGELLNSKAN